MNNMLGYMTVCYKPTLHGCVTSKKAESAPADPVGGLAAWQNSASCDGAQNDLYSSSSSCQNCVCSGAAAVFGKFLNVK